MKYKSENIIEDIIRRLAACCMCVEIRCAFFFKSKFFFSVLWSYLINTPPQPPPSFGIAENPQRNIFRRRHRRRHNRHPFVTAIIVVVAFFGYLFPCVVLRQKSRVRRLRHLPLMYCISCASPSSSSSFIR